MYTAPKMNPDHSTNRWLGWLTETFCGIPARTYNQGSHVRDYHHAVLCIGWYA